MTKTKIIRHKGAYQIKVQGINGQPTSYTPLFEIGAKNYEIVDCKRRHDRN